MNNFLKNTSLAVSLCLSLSMSPVFGNIAEYESYDHEQDRYHAHTHHINHEHYNDHCYNTCGYVESCFSGRGFLRADVLYLRAQQDGFNCTCLPDTINNYIAGNNRFIARASGDSKDPRFNWNAGFRLGAGYAFDENAWDLGAYWTHYQSKDHHHHGDDSNSNSSSIVTAPVNASSDGDRFHWKLNYNVVDVLLGRNFHANCFSFKPFIGVRFAQIHQHVKARNRVVNNTFIGSGSSDAVQQGSADFLIGYEKNKQRFQGTGVVFGLEAIWDVGCGWNLFAGVAGSTLYGRYKLQFEGFDTFLNGTNFCNQHAKSHACQFATDATLGIRWETCYCDDIEVSFQLALEQHRYFNHNRLGDYGDLCLDGVSFAASVSF